MVASEQIGRNDLRIVAVDGRERGSVLRRVTCRVHARVRSTLQKLVPPETAIVACDASGRQIERVEIGRPTRRVHHHVDFDHRLRFLQRRMDLIARRRLLRGR